MEKIISFDNVKGIYGATASVNDGVMRYEFTGQELWPEVEVHFDGGLKGYESVSFDIYVNGNAFIVPFVLTDKNGTRMGSQVSKIIGHRYFPTGEWLHITWNFRQSAKYSVDPPSYEPFDYDSVTKISFCVYSKVAHDFYALVKNLRFSNEASTSDKQKEWENYRDTYQWGGLENKKALLWAWASSKGKDHSGIIHTINSFEYYEKMTAFDGLIMEISGYPYPDPHRRTFFTPEDLDEATLQKAVDAYKAHDWKQFKHNFIRLDVVGCMRCQDSDGAKLRLDWFDEDLFQNKIYPKLTRFAKALKEMGVHLMFDNEGYQENPLDYFRMYGDSERSFEEFDKQLRKRGKEFVEIFEREYPNVTIMTTHGNWMLDFPPCEDRYGLMPSFMDGMCEGAKTVKLVDGFENGYYVASEESVIRGSYDCKYTAKRLSKIPEVYGEKMQNGYALWLRRDWYSHEGFGELLVQALRAAQEYVWVYTQFSHVDNEDVQKMLLVANERLLEAKK